MRIHDAARTAAQLGARVAVCEDRSMGGTCVNLGCGIVSIEVSVIVGESVAVGVHAVVPDLDSTQEDARIGVVAVITAVVLVDGSVAILIFIRDRTGHTLHLVADAAPADRAGSLMTLQTALGFLLTAGTIQAAPMAAAASPKRCTARPSRRRWT